MSNRPSLSLDVALGFHRLLAEGEWGGAKSDTAALECRTDGRPATLTIRNR